jgi:hypothetical protein
MTLLVLNRAVLFPLSALPDLIESQFTPNTSEHVRTVRKHFETEKLR